MGGDNNTDQNITGVTDEELARTNEISQEHDEYQEVSNEISADTRQEVSSATYYDADNDSDDEELPHHILCDDNDDDKDNNDNTSDDRGLPGLISRIDDSDSDDDSDDEDESPPKDSRSKKNK